MEEVGNPVIACCAACAIAAVISQIGDLAASAIKRNHQVKDYGTLTRAMEESWTGLTA